MGFAADGFPGGLVSNPVQGEVVALTETASTLEVLFGFLYPRMRKSDISGLSFEDLLLLAEAAEKYQVFLAMDMCLNRIVSQ